MMAERSKSLEALKDACKSLPLTSDNTDEDGNTISTACPFQIHSDMLGWTWYPIEWDPRTFICFGLVIGDVTELGSFDLEEISKANPEIDKEYCKSLGPMLLEDLQQLHKPMFFSDTSSDASDPSPKPTKESPKPSLELPTSPTSVSSATSSNSTISFDEEGMPTIHDASYLKEVKDYDELDIQLTYALNTYNYLRALKMEKRRLLNKRANAFWNADSSAESSPRSCPIISRYTGNRAMKEELKAKFALKDDSTSDEV